MDEIRLIAGSGSLGSGDIDEAALAAAMAAEPHFIAADAGTTDAGPFALGSGRAAYPRESVKRDLTVLLRAARHARIPVLVGSCGTAGADCQVDWMVDIAGEIARDERLSFRTVAVYAEQSKAYLQELLAADRILALTPAPPLDRNTIERSARVVGMMGVEPLQEAISEGADLVLAGRCSDTALFAAIPMLHGFPNGLIWHTGKVMECGTLCCETPGKGIVLGKVSRDYATIVPFGEGMRCTVQSVAAHSLYENADPYLHTESAGTMDLTNTVFTAIDDKAVRMSGSAFVPSKTYTVKLEGAELAGYQTLIVGGIRDPLIIRQLDSWLAGVRAKTAANAHRVLGDVGAYSIHFHIYGRDAVMGRMEPERAAVPHEVGIVMSVTASTQALATKIAELARQPLLHNPIPEWKGSITSFACLHNPAPVDRGPVYRFTMNHVAVPRTPTEMFRNSAVDFRH